MLRKKTIICQSEVDAKREIVIAALSLGNLSRVLRRKEISTENETDNTNSRISRGRFPKDDEFFTGRVSRHISRPVRYSYSTNIERNRGFLIFVNNLTSSRLPDEILNRDFSFDRAVVYKSKRFTSDAILQLVCTEFETNLINAIHAESLRECG